MLRWVRMSRYCELFPLNQLSMHHLLDTAGWSVTHQEVREHGEEYWVTLEREVRPPTPKHACCTVYGDKAVTEFVGQIQASITDRPWWRSQEKTA